VSSVVRYGRRRGTGNVVALTRGKGSPTYKGFQRAEQLRDALEAAVEQLSFGEACTDGVVSQSHEVDVGVVGVVAL